MEKEIFIVDDDPIYRMIVARMLARMDPSVTIHQCDNGETGLATLEHSKSSGKEVIVLLDINMPLVDGWGYLDQLEKRDFYNIEQLRLYMVSSSIDERDLLKANTYGFIDHFFHKPLSTQNIESILDRAQS